MFATKAVERPKWVQPFSAVDPSPRELVGDKGAGLAEMTALGLPVPPGFTITTDACAAYVAGGGGLPAGMMRQITASIRELESSTGKCFGDPQDPLLVSVRSGAVVSMPGMMDTVLNLGVNRQVAEGIAHRTGNRRFARDIHRRFVQMYGSVVLGVNGARFEETLQEAQRRAGVSRSADLSVDQLDDVVKCYEALIVDATGNRIPEDPWVQLESAVVAVFDSWNNRRAVQYRDFHGISHELGTAVSVVAMVYGNADDESFTGVVFTRDPATGTKHIYGEYLKNAQGEDVVAGTSTPREVSALASEMPKVHRELLDVVGRLERHYRDVQDVEFTVEQRKLYVLQTRSAQRTAKAAVKIAVDMANEGLISRDEALLRIGADQIDQLLLPTIDEPERAKARAEDRLVGTGLAASPGGATGIAAFDADTAQAEELEVDTDEGYLRGGDILIRAGEKLTIDGTTGEVFEGSIPLAMPETSIGGDLSTLLAWADSRRKLGVWANADNANDAKLALDLGAEGIGLCRTEHMFFGSERLPFVREMILSAHSLSQAPDDLELIGRLRETIARLEEFQEHDFAEIFSVMKGRPVVVRLLDPPLHEFLPGHDELLEQVVELRTKGDEPAKLAEKQRLLAVLDELRETNPMLGLRGCRLGLKFPEIYDMQVRAIIRAACRVSADGTPVRPEIMIPLVGLGQEMARLRESLETTIRHCLDEPGVEIEYKIGAMIELPRAALTANEIAETAEFFSFGTNDLTQTVFGLSRDDAEAKFLRSYIESGILAEDPFKVLDRRGVGQLMRTAAMLGRHTRPDIKLGICGEHGGDPSSIEFCHIEGLDYVSCSPYRLPVARLAAAHAAIRAVATPKSAGQASSQEVPAHNGHAG